MPRPASLWLRLAIAGLCTSSVAMLLLHLPGWLRMDAGLRFVLGPALLICAVIVVWFVRSAPAATRRDLIDRLLMGALGGLLGTLGYDLFRVPFHLLGLNVFSPIYAYGLWTAGGEASSRATDTLGFLFHVSNGVTFGVMYAMVFGRRHWSLGVAWALALETLAVVTSFGVVFGLRAYSTGLVIAFVAHIFYGIPLGVVCQRGVRVLGAERPARAHRRTAAAIALSGAALAGFGAWFVLTDGADRPTGSDAEITIADTVARPGIAPRWLDRSIGSSITIHNATVGELIIALRTPHQVTDRSEQTLGAGGRLVVAIDEPGIYQVGVPDRGWRSVFIGAHDAGDYRPR